MLDLSTISFKVETSELDRAGKAIGELVTNVGKLDKAARDAAQTEVALAKAAKLNADANLQNAKAQDVRLKSTITADKADQQATAAIEKKTKATEKVNEVVNKNVGVLQRQKDILEFQTQGFSKGQSSILAYGKAAGLAADDISELGKVLETQRKLMGGDPFDKSLSGLKSLQNQYTELKESVRQYATDSNLTAKQARELARDKERLIEKMKVEGASFSEIRQAVRAHNTEYVNLATSYNKMTSAEDAVIKSRKEAVNATNYLTQADQKMAAALNTSNAALDKAGTDSLVKYETALRKSGVSQDVATLKLAKYKAQLEQVQIQEQKRREQHLTRALAPQATDVVVSLWSGQNPLTVLLQQGGQVTDLFMQSGVAAEKFGEVVKSSMQSMLPSILAVVNGVGGLLVDGLIAAGNATQSFIAGIFGMTGAMDKLYMKLSENGPSKFGGMIQTISSIMTGVFAVGVGVVIAGLAMMAKGAYDSMIAVSDLNKAMVLGGNAFNMTGAQALAYADTLSGANASTLGIIEVMTEMSKVGGFTADQIALVSKAAISMQDYAGVAIKDTVKQFSELGKDPVKALLELARKTGELTVEQIKSVEQLQKQGRAQDAVNLAMKISAGVMDKQSQSLRDQLHPLEKLVAGWKILGRWMWDVTNIAPGTSDALELINKKERLAKSLAAGVSENVPENVALKQEIALLEAKTLTQAQSAANRQAVKDEAAAYQQYSGALAEFDKQLNKADASKMKRQDFINAKIQELGVLENAGKYESTTLSTDRIKQFFKVYGEEWDKAQEKLNKGAKKDLETEIDLRNKDLGLLASFNNELDAIERRRAKTGDEDKYQASLNALIEKQPIYLERQKEINAAHDLANKLTGKADMLGKDYYKTLEQIQEFQDSGLYSTEKAEALRKAAYSQTELAKQQLKYIEESTKLRIQYSEESKKSLDASSLENQKLDDRVALLGLTSEQQKYLKIQQQQRNSLLGVDLKLSTQIAKIWEDVRQGKLDPFDAMAAQLEAEKAAAEERKTINREVAVQYAEDLQKEFDAIKNGISDSIVTALFEGGKAGSKKIRDLVVAELRKPVTMVVNAVVNTVLGSVIGSLMGGAAAGAANSSSGGGIGMGGLSGLSSLWDMVSGGLNIAAVFGQKIAMQMGGRLAIFGMETASELIGQFGAGMMNTSSIGAFSQAFQAGGAQMAGAIAGSVLNGFSGYSISKLISGGYQVNKYIDKIAGVASMIPGIGPIAGVVGGVFNQLFGRKLKESGIEGTFGGETGFEGRTYQYYKGGLFRSNKTKYGELDEETRSNFAKVFFDMKDGVSEMAKMLGLGTESLEDFTYKFKVNLKGLSEEEATKKIQEQFQLMGEEMAKLVLTTDEYSLAEETRMDTLIRLSSTLTTVNTIFENMGMTMYDISLTGADAAYELSQLFGGLGQFTSVMSNYYDKFYSDSEKQILLQSQLDRAFKDLGVSVPKTRDEFRDLVESQDLTTEEGRKLFAELMKLVAGFDALASQADLLANARTDINYRMMEQETQLLAAQGRTVEADKKRRELLDKQRGAEYERLMKINPELARLTAELWALEDATVAAANAAAKAKEIADTRQDLTDRILQQEAELLDAQGRTAEADRKRRELLDRQRARENERLMALSPELARLAYELWLLEDATAAATRAAKERKEISNDLYNALVKAVDAEKTLLNEQKARLEETISTLKSVFDILKSSVDELYGEVSSTASMQASEGRNVIAQAISTGILPDSKLLDTSIQAVRDEISNSLYVSKADADKAQLIFAAQLALLKDTTEEQLTDAEKQLKAVNAQISYLDNILKTAKEQLDAFLGNTEVLKSVDKALADLYAFLQNPSAAKPVPKPVGTEKPGNNAGTGGGAVFGPGTGTSKPSTVNSDGNIVYADGSIGYRNSWIDNSGVKHYGFVSKEIWETERARGTPGYPAFANGGYYPGGMALVGEEGPELINFSNPGQVYTAKQTASMLSGESSEVVAELKAVRSEIIMLRAEVRADVSHNAKTAKLLDRVIPEGDSVQVTIS